jgi:hypothetical protein
VEKLLPPHPRSPRTLLGSGGSQGIQYWVDENWQVTCVYDYTGVPRDENGNSLERYSPANKLLTMPRLTRKSMPPPIEVMSFEVRDPSDAWNREAPASQ